MAKKKNQKKKSSKSGAWMKTWFSPEQRTSYRQGLGIVMLILSIFLLLSFGSSIHQFANDHSIVTSSNPDFSEVENLMGGVGAKLSHYFIEMRFGIGGAFALALAIGLVGLNFVRDSIVVSYYKIFKELLFFMTFSMVTTGVFRGHLIEVSYPIDGRISASLFGQSGLFTYLIGFGGVIGLSVIITLAYVAHCLGLNVIKLIDGFFSLRWLPSLKKKEEADEEEVTFAETAFERDGINLSGEGQAVDELSQETVDSKDATLAVGGKIQDDTKTQKPEKKPTTKEVEDNTYFEIVQKEKEEVKSSSSTPAAKKPSGDEYDPTKDLSKYAFPTIDLLADHGSGDVRVDEGELVKKKEQIVETLRDYKIEIESIRATVGPTVTLYEIVPAKGVRISKIKNLEDDIALSLSALGIRIIAPIPGKGTIGIEVPNAHKEVVSMRSVVASELFKNSNAALPVGLGKNIAGEYVVADLAKMPHLLMAGATGQGKSVGINALLVSLLYKLHPSELKFVLVDPKKVELSLFNSIKHHYLAVLPGEEEPIITDVKKVVSTVNALCLEMDNRYDLLKKGRARNIKEYNAKFKKRQLNPENGHRFLPYIVLVIDEFADLIMTAGKEVETPIARLAQLARAIGIHLILATQRPSVNIITGIIKANFPARVSFKVTSKVDSRTILDAGGADQLIGRGDLLFSMGSDMVRIQCAFVDTPEVDAICRFIGDQQGYGEIFELPEFKDKNEGGDRESLSSDDMDPLLEEAARIVVGNQSGSTSMIQRRLKLGYNRAGRIMDQLEELGIVGPNMGSKPREVMYSSEQELEQYLLHRKQ
jgi:S-DNA-T family DNA segregation ATPase FtsK/SpoIIIE